MQPVASPAPAKGGRNEILTLAADLRAALEREKRLREALEQITGCQYDLAIARAAIEGRK